MSRGEPTQEVFDKLLRWLDPDRDKAGEKYSKIQFRLIGIFSSRGCCNSEDLTDITFNIVNSKIDWLLENYVGDPALYFYGVAKKIYLEQRKKSPPEPPPPAPDRSQLEDQCSCLEKCLKQELNEAEGRLVLRYHEKEKSEKIFLRKQLAAEWGITINALRIKMHHIHSRLRSCIDECMKDLPDQ